MPCFLTKRGVRPIGFLLLLLAMSAAAQVRIQPLPGMDVPTERVDLLFDVTCRVVAEEFRLRDTSEVQIPVTLVLGEGRDGVVGDETEQIFTICMSRWDETMFATAVSRIALQHLVSRDRKARIVGESLRRVHQIAPISKDALQATNHHDPQNVGPASAVPSLATPLNSAHLRSPPPASPSPAEGEDHAHGRSISLSTGRPVRSPRAAGLP